MIYLKTGQPGHGKTLRAIEKALEYVAQGRLVFAHGIRGLNYEAAGFQRLDDPTKWESLPDGSVVLADECYSWLPKGGGTAKVPPYIDALARHRHRGFDFILVCQQASKQLHPFVHGLVDHHEHIRRKFGFKKAIILSWDRYESNTKNSDSKRFWSYPKALMKRNLYESTTQDTTEKRIPLWMIALPIVLVVIGLLIQKERAFWSGDKSAEASEQAKPKASSMTAIGGGESAAKRPEDLVKWFKPRIPGAPWSAPAYDDRPVTSEPELYCIAVDDGRCSCITEQGTKYAVEPAVCRAVAREGSYNPTRRAVQQQRQQMPPQGVQAPQGAQAQPQAAVSSDGLSSSWKPGVGAEAYQPPGAMPWNSDPWGAKSSH